MLYRIIKERNLKKDFMIYLDAAASAGYKEVDDIVVSTISNAMKEYWLNPSSLYATKVKEEINECRANIAKFIGAKSNEIYFTSGSSESNNWAIRGWVDNILMNSFQFIHIITTPIEHKSILEAVNNGALGARIHYCDVNKLGLVDYKSLKCLLAEHEHEPVLVSIGMANNEIGTIQNVKEISDLVHEYGGVLHIDATQCVGHIPIDVNELGIDMLSASGHKISPVLKGIGFLYKKNCINIRPLIHGSQESGLRGGTENTFGIIGLSKAIDCCDIGYEKIKNICNKRDYFVDLLISKFGCILNGHCENRLPNNINVTFPQNITGESLLYTLDLSDIKLSVGSACNSHDINPSHVLTEIGLDKDAVMKTVRFTLPDNITYRDIDFVVDEINKALKIIEV